MQFNYEAVEQTLNYVFQNATKGDVDSVLKAFDEIGTKLWIMTIGHIKGKLIVDQLKKHNPKTGIELGSYIGYSAIMFGQHFKSRGDGHYYCIEYNPILASVVREVVEFAGLTQWVTVLHGDLAKNIPILKSQHGVDTVDFFFIDHLKELYTADFELADQNNLFNKNSIVIADNILLPGAPEFLAHMKSHPKYKHDLIEASLNFMGKPAVDAILVAQQN